MPSHIYSMVGLCEESIESNMPALEVRKDYYHAADFAVYAHLQLGQDAKAKALLEQARKVAESGSTGPGSVLGFRTAMAAMPARLVIERGDWKGAAALPVTSTDSPAADSLTRFTRSLGMARTGNSSGAQAEVKAMQALRELYAELLLEMGRAAPALHEFEAALKSYPNRYRIIYGIAARTSTSARPT